MKNIKDDENIFLKIMCFVLLIIYLLLIITGIHNYIKNESEKNKYEYTKIKEEVNSNIYDTRIEKNPMLIEIDRLSTVTVNDTIRYYIYFEDGAIEVSKNLYNEFKEGDTIIIAVYRIYKNDKLKSTYYEYEGKDE